MRFDLSDSIEFHDDEETVSLWIPKKAAEYLLVKLVVRDCMVTYVPDEEFPEISIGEDDLKTLEEDGIIECFVEIEGFMDWSKYIMVW